MALTSKTGAVVSTTLALESLLLALAADPARLRQCFLYVSSRGEGSGGAEHHRHRYRHHLRWHLRALRAAEGRRRLGPR